MSVDEVQRIDDQGLAAWGETHSPDAFAALCADDIVWHDVSLPEPIRGKEGVRQYIKSWLAAFPDMKATRKNRILSEDSVAVELEWIGTHTGPFQGPPGTPAIPPTGKKVTGRGAYFAQVRGGKIAVFSAHPDVAGMMMQLGLMGPPGA